MSAECPLKRVVVLCRGITENNSTHDEYIETLTSAGYNCHHLATLRFEFVSLERLKDRLLLPNLYGGLIVTSRRAIEAIRLALQGDCLPKQWNNLPVYCVGPSTTYLARNDLKLTNCMGSTCGNAKDLANYIVVDVPKDTKSLLYPCSVIARDTIQRVLNDNGISVDKVTVYDTLPAETLETDLKRVIDEQQRQRQIFVFFSPSAVEYILSAAARQSIDFVDKITAVAIGPASAEALVKAGITVHAVSTKPQPQALLGALRLAGL